MATWRFEGFGSKSLLLAKPYFRKMNLVGAQRMDWRELCFKE